MSRLVPVLLLLIPILLSAGENLAPLVSAKAAILMDRQTGLVLWEKNADWRLPMASNPSSRLSGSKRALILMSGPKMSAIECLYWLSVTRRMAVLNAPGVGAAAAAWPAGVVEFFRAVVQATTASAASDTHAKAANLRKASSPCRLYPSDLALTQRDYSEQWVSSQAEL